MVFSRICSRSGGVRLRLAPSTAEEEAPMARILSFWRFCSAAVLLGSGASLTLFSPHSLPIGGGSGGVFAFWAATAPASVIMHAHATSALRMGDEIIAVLA